MYTFDVECLSVTQSQGGGDPITMTTPSLMPNSTVTHRHPPATGTGYVVKSYTPFQTFSVLNLQTISTNTENKGIEFIS